MMKIYDRALISKRNFWRLHNHDLSQLNALERLELMRFDYFKNFKNLVLPYFLD